MFEKLDAYNLIANFIPGAALVYPLNFSGFPAPEPDNIAAFVLVAFVTGVATNRLGSLILDPFLRSARIGFLHKKDYPAFVGLEKNDPKLETLVANAGLYRTFITAGLIYFFLLALESLATYCNIGNEFKFTALVVLGMAVFLYALRKEDGYIRTRIDRASETVGYEDR